MEVDIGIARHEQEFDSAGNVGDDIKTYLDWSKFGYDTDGNNSSDVSFAVGEIASATVVATGFSQ